MRIRVLILTALVAAMAVTAAAADKGVARFNGVVVTDEELDRAIGSRLMRIRSEEYQLKVAVLDELIAEKLLAAEAARRGLPVGELLKIEVDAKTKVPADSDLETMYDGMRERFGNMPKEAAIAEMRTKLQGRKALERKEAFVKELRAKAAVEVLIQPPRAEVRADGPARGNPDAPVTIIGFSDFECQFCGRAAETLRTVEQRYGDKVRIVHRDYPLVSHKGATKAAEAAHCAAEQGKFWEMHDKLFAKGGSIARPDLTRFARELQIETEPFESCVDSGKYKATWQRSFEEGGALGVRSTPTFFINGRLVAGAASLEAFARLIDDELARAPRRDSVKAAAK
jgi:protein-disulfide isomerase